jgi:peptidoglycan/xylan/chitin deacetylase (PgdA/CDA1 family)
MTKQRQAGDHRLLPLLLAVTAATAVFVLVFKAESGAGGKPSHVPARVAHPAPVHHRSRRHIHRFRPGHERPPRPPLGRLASTVTFCPILMYHYIRAYTNQLDPIGIGLSVAPAVFRQEMWYIHSHGFHTVTIAQLARHIRYGTPLPRNPVALTFDDGYRDQFTKALPALRRDHLRATFFIVSGFVDQPRYMTWRQVRKVDGAGMEIGVHTIHHLDLTTVTPWQDWQEIYHSKVVIERHLGHPAVVFAYPSGAFDQQVLQDVRKAGYLAAVSTLPGTIHAQMALDYLFRVEILGTEAPSTVEPYLTYRFGDPFQPTPTVP